jgi:hypothetical protein
MKGSAGDIAGFYSPCSVLRADQATSQDSTRRRLRDQWFGHTPCCGRGGQGGQAGEFSVQVNLRPHYSLRPYAPTMPTFML